MYSVEDLLISHGYKLPKHSTPTPGPLAHTMPLASPPSYRRERQLLERPRTVNGFERGSTGLYRCSLNNSEAQDRSQSRQEGPPGGSLPHDTRFCEVNRGPQLQSKDVSYWRRKGQDFAVLLDYTDYKEAAGARQGNYMRPEGPQQARGQEPGEERQRTDRQQWGGAPGCREQPLHWRTAERKCQSLGAEEWHPSGERCSQEQQRLHARTPEGMVHPRIKAKTQSLPRVLQPDSLQYVGRGSGQELYKRVSGQPLFHQSIYRAPRWPDSGRPASAVQLSITPKPRFTRPPRPPSYEMHQQIRGSCEVLSGRDSVHPPTRDRTPLPMLRTESQMDYFAQDSGPPGYIPPPSYKRAPIMGGGCREYGEVAINYRYRGDVYHQVHVAPDGSHWFPRQVSHQRQLYPVYSTQQRPTGRVQYIPFDDPHISHISSAMGGNSLTDADKIRHIRKELPSVTVSEPASGDSAFLPPPLGPSLVGKLGNDSNPSSSREFDSNNTRWHSNLHKETVDNIPATDQNCNNRYHRIHHAPPASPFSAFHAPKTDFRCSSEQGFLETVTQVKQISPDSSVDNNRNTKRRVSETIFCLVSVPVHTPTNFSKDASSDQNNNDTTSSLTLPSTFAVGLKESRPVRSKSVQQAPIWGHYSQFYTSSTSSLRNYKRAPLRKEIIDAWALQANEDRDMYSKSWPGNQYRNQETQTGSPITVVKSPERQISQEKATQSISVMNSDYVGVIDRTSSNGYLIEGQKKLQLSSNSAFSLLSPTQSTSVEASPPELPSPSIEPNKVDQQPSSPSKKMSSPLHSPKDNPTETSDQVAFGQFLLKPVNRRPFDYIGELETINKEMEDTISKRPNVGVCKGTKKLNLHQSGVQSVEEIFVEKPSNIKVRSKSSADLDLMESSTSFLRPQESLVPTKQPSVDDILSSGSLESELVPIDIPVPQESLLKDVGLTVYTETSPREHVPRSCSVPPLQKFDELLWDGRKTGPNLNNTKELKSKPDHKHHLSGVSLRICRSRSESSRSSHKRECSPHVIKLNREVTCLYSDDDLDSRYAILPPQISSNESTIADKHLEDLLIQEKANSLPTEDLSKLYEVKCAEGIPENESIEERAARILGLPVEALGGADKKNNENNEDANQEVIEGSVEVQKESIVEDGEISEEKANDNELKIELPEVLQNESSLSMLAAQDLELAETICNEEENVQVRESLSAECAIPDNTDKPEEEDTTTGISLNSTNTCSDGLEANEVNKGQCTNGELQEVEEVKKDLGEKVEKPCEKDATQCDSMQDKSEGDCCSGEVDVQECKETQGNEVEQVKDDIALIENEGIKEVAEVTRLEDPEKIELEVVEERKENLEVSKGTRGPSKAKPAAPAAAPKPKQRTKLQKPALLPKPRSVPKREITLPRCSPAAMGDQDKAIPDSYDPSRVERV